jgi:hypothetical protein
MPRSLLNAFCFQAGWFACVAGGNRVALLAAVLLLPLHARFVSRCAREWALAAALAGIGLAMDLGWQAAGLLRFEGSAGALPPLWLALLWLLFAQALFHSLAWLQRSAWLAAAIGAIAGPLSYAAGLKLGGATSSYEAWQIALVMGPAWALLLPLMAGCARRGLPTARVQALP